MPAAEARPYDAVDLASLDFWSRSARERDTAFAALRQARPVSWQPPAQGGAVLPGGDDPGFWAVVRHADVTAVSRAPEVFCSGQGVGYEDVPPMLTEAAHSFLAMDHPRHTVLRRLVSSAFTPRRIAAIEAQIRRQARAIVDDLADSGPGDFVTSVAMRLPMWTISDMIGVPEHDRARITGVANSLVGYNDPDVVQGREPLQFLFEGIVELGSYAVSLAAERREVPADDLLSALIAAEVDGQRLTDDEIGAFFVLLSVAGNDTTRHTMSHAMVALRDFPAQRALLVADFEARIDGAVEDMIRWATPVMTFRRPALSEATLGGRDIAAGDKVVMFYSSANRDEAVFDDPWRFDMTRDPNRHVGFGGGGPHYCLGASLARTQLRAIFGELLSRIPDLEVGEPQYLVGNFIHGIRRLPCQFDRVAQPAI